MVHNTDGKEIPHHRVGSGYVDRLYEQWAEKFRKKEEAAMNIPVKYVNVYLVDRVFGGREEGGWWYEVGDPVEPEEFDPQPASVLTVSPKQVAQRMEEHARLLNSERRSDISSMLSDGRFEVRIEDHPPLAWPPARPHYE